MTDPRPLAVRLMRLSGMRIARVWAVVIGVWGGVMLPALADVGVRFIEGAPKDRFELTNRSTCPLTMAQVTFDLRPSAAGLIFDVTGQGAGVDVFQPFELVVGAAAVASHSPVRDGDQELALRIRELQPGAMVAFTVDVDDTLGPRGITVSGSEIASAVVRVDIAGISSAATFSAQGSALVKTPACPSPP